MILFGKKREKQVESGKETLPVKDDISTFKAAEAFVQAHRTGIKILGTDIVSCTAFKEAVDNVLADFASGERAEHISDVFLIAAFGAIYTPALVIDGKIVSSGRVLQSGEIAALIKKRR